MARLGPGNARCLARALDHHPVARQLQGGRQQLRGIQIIADKGLPFDDVMKAHTTLSKAGVKRIAFGVVSSSSN